MDGRVIYLDVTSSCKSPMNTGVQRVVRGLYRSLSTLGDVTPVLWDPALTAYCTLSRREKGFLEMPFAKRVGDRIGDAEPGRRANPVPVWSKFARTVVHRWNRLDLPARLTGADTLFVPEIFQDNRVVWLAALGARTSARRVGVCHDAIAWRRPDITPPARQAGFAEYLDTLGTFEQVVAVSQATADDLAGFWRERGRTTLPPISVHPWPVNHGGVVRPLTPPPAPTGRRSVLCVGTFEPRKNHLVLLDAAEMAWQRGGDFALVLIGRTLAGWGGRVSEKIEQLRTAGRAVRWLRHVDDETLRRAYEECAFTVFPSLVEGYGLPILESLWHGRPCVCGVNGALGELIAGGGCLSVDQTDSAALAAALEDLLADQTLYRRLCEETVARSFPTWEVLAAALLPALVTPASPRTTAQ